MTTNTMEMKSEFTSICRICLQDGELYSIFHKNDDSELNYSEKIMQCTNIEVKKDQTLPEQICSSCIMDLEASYRFKMNCESSDAILQTYVVSNVSNVSGSVDEDEEDGDEECTEDEESDNYADESDLYNYKASMYDENGALIAGDDIKKEKGTDDYGEYAVRKGASNDIGEVSTRTKKDGTKETIVRLKRAMKGSVVDDKQPKIHICEICANTYKYRHALEVHMRRHRGDKPYNCEHCDRRFVIRFELKRHMRTHTGQKPYGCRFCERKFSDFGSRIKHERSHTGERPYVCQTCGKTFAYSHVLSGHMLTHTGEKRHQCNQCGKRFTKSHHLKSHLNTHLKALNKSVGGVNNQQQQMPSSSMMQQQRPPNMLEPMKHELQVQDEQELLNVVHGVMHGGGFQVITEKY